MIKNILIYIAVLAISFSFAVFYYAWFSNFLLIVVLCLPVLSLLCSLPFMIYSAVKGFSLYASKAIYAGDDVVINLAANNRSLSLIQSPSPRDLSTSRMPSSA